MFRALVAAACVCAVFGCATSSPEAVDVAAQEATDAVVPAVPEAWEGSGSAEPVQVGWIASFEDELLSEFVEEAQGNNLNLAAAAAGVDRARALARQAGAALAPEVSLGAGADRGGRAGGTGSASSSMTATAQVSWELDVWGRVRAGVRSATESARAIEADYRFAQHSLAANTAIAYFTAVEANLQTDIAREALDVLNETNRIVEARYADGLSSSQELALARSDAASARERVVTLEGANRNALRALELLLGRYPGADITVRDALPEVPSAPPAGLPSGLLERRPDLVAAERRVAAAFNAVEQARAAQLPSIGLTGSVGAASDSVANLLSPENVAWRTGVSLLAPLYDGGRRRESVVIATAEQEQALAAYGDAALRAFSEIESALDQGVVLERRAMELAEAEEQAARAFRIAQLQYDEGEIGLIDLFTIQQRVISASSALSSVVRLQLEQRVNLHLGLGGDWR